MSELKFFLYYQITNKIYLRCAFIFVGLPSTFTIIQLVIHRARHIILVYTHIQSILFISHILNHNNKQYQHTYSLPKIIYVYGMT